MCLSLAIAGLVLPLVTYILFFKKGTTMVQKTIITFSWEMPNLNVIFLANRQV